MKLEVGMYVRTRRGLIAKFTEVEKTENDEYNKYIFDGKIYWYYEYYNEYVYEEDFEYWFENSVVKISHNIIDLIEVGDYVNGQKVYYDEELDFLYVKCFDRDGEFYQESITKKSFIDNIKTIVTKEQFQDMEYRLGE